MCSCIFLFSKAENRLQWIQKLGRARAENSKAFIFENNVNEEEAARREMKRVSRDPSIQAVEEELINERKRTQADSLDHFFAEGKGKVNLSNSQSMYEGYCAKAMSRMNRSQDGMWEYKIKGQKVLVLRSSYNALIVGYCNLQRIVVSLSFPTPSGIKNISIAAMQGCKPKVVEMFSLL